MRGDVLQANEVLEACLNARDGEGSLPEQFDVTYQDQTS
jgi:hypothetical protein